MRSALWRAAVRRPTLMAPAGPNWLVVSMTVRLSSGPVAASASSMPVQGTAKTTTSAVAARAGLTVRAPMAVARVSSLRGSQAKLTETS